MSERLIIEALAYYNINYTKYTVEDNHSFKIETTERKLSFEQIEGFNNSLKQIKGYRRDLNVQASFKIGHFFDLTFNIDI